MTSTVVAGEARMGLAAAHPNATMAARVTGSPMYLPSILEVRSLRAVCSR